MLVFYSTKTVRGMHNREDQKNNRLAFFDFKGCLKYIQEHREQDGGQSTKREAVIYERKN